MQSTDSNEKAREQDVDNTAHEYMPQHVAVVVLKYDHRSSWSWRSMFKETPHVCHASSRSKMEMAKG